MFPIFTATRTEQIPVRCKHFISVDGAVPGAAVTWDHHQTGERINLECVPNVVDIRSYDGIATTLADTDALASVVAVLCGGVGGLPPDVRAILECASHYCDHLLPHPAHGTDVNVIGRGLDNFVGGSLARARNSRRSGVFAGLCRLVFRRIRDREPLPRAFQPSWSDAVQAVERAGGLTSLGSVLIVDLRRPRRRVSVRPDAWYLTRPACRVAVIADRHPKGGVRYTVGHNPFHADFTDIRPILARLAEAEFQRGPPALAPRAEAGCENWGGRREVGGSPWNYGSRLTLDEVVAWVAVGL